VGVLLLIVLLGMVFGAFLGELVGAAFPGSWFQALLTKGPQIGLTSPATFDLKFLTFTLGLAIKVNVAALLGVIAAAVLVRKM
jgi:hypothetical protein